MRPLIFAVLMVFPGFVLVFELFRTDRGGDAASMTAVGSTQRTAVAGRPLTRPLSVRVLDSRGQGVGGVEVRWSVAAGRGRVRRPRSSSDQTGLAQIAFTTDSMAGPNVVTAVVSSLSDTTVFSIRGEPGLPAAITMVSDLAVDDTIRLRVTDGFGNPIAGATLTWRIGRSGSTTAVETDGGGIALITGVARGLADSLFARVEPAPELALPLDTATVVATDMQNVDGTMTSPGAVVSQTPVFTWERRSSGQPSARSGHRIAYDTFNGVGVLFGGVANRQLGDMWIWESGNWSRQILAVVPSARSGHAMAFDGVNGVILFGGMEGVDILDDLWVWDGRAWNKRTPPRGPPGRHGHMMAFDAGRQRVLLFGGQGNAGLPFRDTWEWDGTAWRQASSALSPPPRINHALAYDARRGRVVLFGGRGIAAPAGLLDDTWEWDGTNWSRVPTFSAPPGVSNHSLAFDALRGRVVLFGGVTGGGLSNETWEFDGTAWVRRAPSDAPPPRQSTAMFFDREQGGVVLFGGTGAVAYADTWLYTGN